MDRAVTGDSCHHPSGIAADSVAGGRGAAPATSRGDAQGVRTPATGRLSRRHVDGGGSAGAGRRADAGISELRLVSLHALPGAPASKSRRLGTYLPLTIGAKKVLCFKSELHLSQDGVKLPVRKLWHQLLGETRARVVITTGTAGAIGADVKLGDVVLGRAVRFDCSRTFARESFSAEQFHSPLAVPLRRLDTAMQKLIPVNAGMLPAPHHRLRFYYDGAPPREAPTVVTYKLQGLGAAVEMGDAVLGLVCQDLGSAAPGWLAIRNASDPQIDGTLPLDEQKKTAARIYERYGYWTTVGSAIATWAVIAGSP